MVEDTILFFTCKFLLSNVIVMRKKSDIQVEEKGESGAAIRRRSFDTGDHKDAGL